LSFLCHCSATSDRHTPGRVGDHEEHQSKADIKFGG